MIRVIQLTNQLFEQAEAVAQAAENLKKRDAELTYVVFPEAHVEDIFGMMADFPIVFEARSYKNEEGKLKAALWAAQLGAGVVEQWTLVKGLYTANPSKVRNAKIIEALNYQEAQELASAGTGLLDRQALQILQNHSIELHIRGVFSMNKTQGTVVNEHGSDQGVKAISTLPQVALILLSGTYFAGVAGVDARAFTALARAGISVRIASQASSERSLGIVVDEADCVKAEAALLEAFVQDEGVELTAKQGLTVLNIIGRHNYALERAIYEMRRNNIWLHLIANSVEGHQISLVLDGKWEQKAMDLVHRQLLGAVKQLNVFCFGKGLVGGTFIRQVLESAAHVREKRKLEVNLIGVADSTRSYFNPSGLPEDWRDALAQSTVSNDPESIADTLKNSGLSNIVIVDNTADLNLTDQYPLFVRSGFDLVASNKKGNSREQEFYDNLRAQLSRKGKSFKYETNVGAGLPLIDTLVQLHHSHDTITRIKGVFSGSMSFLFNTFSAEDRKFSAVLAEAQLSGYTEPDPREDLNGMDVARKLLILARTIDIKSELSEVRIQNLIPEHLRGQQSFAEFKAHYSELDAHYGPVKAALAEDEVLRYVGDLQIDEKGNPSLEVALVKVKKSSPLGSIQGSDSLFEIYTEGYGNKPMVIQGAGAGAEVTARGVYSDVLRLG